MESSQGRIQPTISIGVTTTYKACFTTAFNLVQAADVALYRAKHAGRNRMMYCSAERMEAAAAL